MQLICSYWLYIPVCMLIANYAICNYYASVFPLIFWQTYKCSFFLAVVPNTVKYMNMQKKVYPGTNLDIKCYISIHLSNFLKYVIILFHMNIIYCFI